MKVTLSTYVKMFPISVKLTGLNKYTLFGYPKDGPLLYILIPNSMENLTYLLNPLLV